MRLNCISNRGMFSTLPSLYCFSNRFPYCFLSLPYCTDVFPIITNKLTAVSESYHRGIRVPAGRKPESMTTIYNGNKLVYSGNYAYICKILTLKLNRSVYLLDSRQFNNSASTFPDLLSGTLKLIVAFVPCNTSSRVTLVET